VEDDEVDVLTVQRAMDYLHVDNRLLPLPDADSLLEYFTDPAYEKPWLIILDLNMPRMNGIELLQHLRYHPRFNDIPVIILTTSNEETDKVRCFQYGIAGYFVKPVEYETFLALMRIIFDYWKHCEYPRDHR
jgi:CheY-like chemotaxis protein